MNLWCGFMLALVAGTRTASAARQPGGAAAGLDVHGDTVFGSALGTGAGAGAGAAEAHAEAEAAMVDLAGAMAAPARAAHQACAA